MDDLGDNAHDDKSNSYAGQDRRGAIDGVKVSGKAMKDVDMSAVAQFLEKVKKILPGLVLLTPDAKATRDLDENEGPNAIEDPLDAAIDVERMDVVGNPDENKGPNAKEDPSYATIDGEHMDVVGNPCGNEGPIAKEPISHALNTLVDKKDVLMTDAHDTINHADPPSDIFAECLKRYKHDVLSMAANEEVVNKTQLLDCFGCYKTIGLEEKEEEGNFVTRPPTYKSGQVMGEVLQAPTRDSIKSSDLAKMRSTLSTNTSLAAKGVDTGFESSNAALVRTSVAYLA
ncbi:hypothetical protein Tco_0707239 [Tanacetum coccineum]|uniref:Uncharacterized protein n=1 Tax=Tanacetum coccineum TaxID=301880 RepID=A0ABQ4Y9P5_9ASTR